MTGNINIDIDASGAGPLVQYTFVVSEMKPIDNILLISTFVQSLASKGKAGVVPIDLCLRLVDDTREFFEIMSENGRDHRAAFRVLRDTLDFSEYPENTANYDAGEG